MTAREVIVLNEDVPQLEALQTGDTYELLSNVGIAGAITTVDYVQFDITYADGQAEGRLQWNADDGTLEYGLPGGSVNLQLGQEMVVKARNESGSPITNGQVVYATGSHGSDRITIAPARADAVPQALAIGLATENIDNTKYGYVTLFGLVRGINTAGFIEGYPVFLSSSVYGGLQQNRPVTGSAYAVFIGYVIRAHATEGVIACHPDIIPRPDRLSGVKYENPSDGEVHRYVAANNQYELYVPHDVGKANSDNMVYIQGDGTTNTSIRLQNNISNNGVIVEKRIADVWVPYPLNSTLIAAWMTTAERDAMTPVNGMIIYNTTTHLFNFYENGSWVTK
jgi:hypothetical protein